MHKKLKNQKAKKDKSKNDYGRFCPSSMKKSKLEEAKTFRNHMLYMIGAHCCFAILEVTLYNFMVVTFVFELFYIWILYYTYMTLNWCTAWTYFILMVLAPITGALNILFVGLFSMFFYAGQLCIYGYFGAYVFFMYFRSW